MLSAYTQNSHENQSKERTMKNKLWFLMATLVALGLLASACVPAATPQVV